MSHRVMPLTSYSLPYSLLTSHFWIALDCPSQIGTKKVPPTRYNYLVSGKP